MNAERTNTAIRAGARHRRRVAQTLELADAAAARGDYVDALACLHTLEQIGHELDSAYENRRETWRSKLDTGRVGCSQWFG